MKPEVKVMILAGTLSLLLSSCAKNQKAAQGGNDSTPKSQLQSRTESSDTYPASIPKIDLDLTKMSATMIYSTIFDMLVMAEEYQNKTIKVKGNFNILTDSFDGNPHYAILIPDATACCVQGLEFLWEGNHTYPQDFPQQDQEIILTGIYRVVEDEIGLQRTYLQVENLDF